MILYKTVMSEANVEQIINKSRFIGYVSPVESREEAEEFIARIKAEHKAASHNVPAFVVGDHFQLQWASDDGEPQGTSGAPIIQMLIKEEITNIALVITRYFGGIKLGTGGLVRAYTGTAKLAIEASTICVVKELIELKIRLDYTFLGKLQNIAINGKFEVTNTVFEDMVTTDILFEPEYEDEIKALLSNLTSGNVTIISESKKLVKSKL